METIRPFPTDIDGIKKVGIEKWQKDFFMPFTGVEFSELYDSLLKSYVEYLNSKRDKTFYDVGISCIAVVHLFADIVFFHRARGRLASRGYTHLLADELIGLEAPYYHERVKSFQRLCSLVRPIGLREGIVSLVRFAMGLGKGWLFFLFASRKRKRAYLLGNIRQPEVRHYLDQEKVQAIQMNSSVAFLLFPLKLPFGRSRDWSGLVNHMLECVSKESADSGRVKVDGSLREALVVIFEKAERIYGRSRFVWSFLPRFNLIGTSAGLPFYRLAHRAWQSLGRTSIGFMHGNNFSQAYSRIWPLDVLSCVSEVVAGSRGERDLLARAKQDFSSGMSLSGVIRKTPVSMYSEMKRKTIQGIQQDKVSEIRTVMVVGFPLTDYFYPAQPFDNLPVQLDLSLRVIDDLKSWGFSVLYKIHPDRIEEGYEIFSSRVDEVVKGRLEDVWSRADCLLFTYSNTTTFGFTLLTDKPMVLITPAGPSWDREAWRLLGSRCAVVEATSSSSGRVEYAKDKLRNAVSSECLIRSDEILKRFAFE